MQMNRPWLLLCALPLLLILFRLWRRLPPQDRRIPQRTIPLLLRAATVLLIMPILCGVSFITNRAGQSLLLLVDGSDSTQQVRAQMSEDVSRILDDLPANAQLAVAAFAADSEMQSGFSHNPASPDLQAELDGTSTSLAAALYALADGFPPNTLRRIAVLTDGRLTDGNPEAAVSELANKGIRMDAILYKAPEQSEAQVDGLDLPADTALGQLTRATVHVTASEAMRASLSLYDGEFVLAQKDVELVSGKNVFSLTFSPSAPGMRTYCAQLEPQADVLEQNNRCYQTMFVTSGNSILVVDGTGEEGGPLCELLSANGYSVERVSCADAPDSVTALCQYGLIILMNTDTRDLPHFFGEHLEQYVSVYGRSVLTSGGLNTYIFGGMKDTTLEALLPIDMQVEIAQSKDPLALLLLLDNSASMEGTAITMAKRGAIKSIESLHDNDYVGVITFSTEHGVLAPLSLVGDSRASVIQEISGLGTVMGTMYAGALAEAYSQLAQFDGAQQKHVILLSDGNPSDSGFESFIVAMREVGITTSTIALGQDVSESLMEHLAELGGGACYIVTSSYDLPGIMMTDTLLLQVEYECEGAFTPLAQDGAWRGQTIPQLTGYVRAQAKADAQVRLATAEDHPIYAVRHVGSGLSASLLSDLSGQWSRAWFQSEAGHALILSMVSELLPGAHSQSAVTAQIDAGGAYGTLTVQSADGEDGGFYRADVVTPNGAQIALSLTPVGNGLHRSSLPLDGFGAYSLTLHQYDESRQEVAVHETAVSVSWSREYDAFGWEDDEAQMRALCAATGGTIVHSAQELLSVRTDDMRVQVDLTHVLATAATLLMLADVLIRRLRPGFLSAAPRANRRR